jgi:phage gpG-like protein
MKSVTTPGYKGNIWKQEGTKLVWGTDLVYAGIHQNGDASRKIPARPYLVIRDQWRQKLISYVVDRATRLIETEIKRAA